MAVQTQADTMHLPAIMLHSQAVQQDCHPTPPHPTPPYTTAIMFNKASCFIYLFFLNRLSLSP